MNNTSVVRPYKISCFLADCIFCPSIRIRLKVSQFVDIQKNIRLANSKF